MPLIRVHAVVLQSFAYSETSKVLRLLTGEHGVLSVLARGALRPRSRFGGVLEPFTAGSATVFMKETRELQTLDGFDLTRSRQGLGRDLLRFGGASLLAELVLHTAIEAPDQDLFDHFDHALDRMERCAGGEVESLVLAEIWALVSRLGFAPTLDQCLTCGRPLDAGEETRFDYPAGGVRCRACGEAPHGRLLPAAARAALARLCQGEPVPLERTAAHWDLLSRFLAFHVLEGRQLRSLAFLTETVGFS